MAYSQFSKKDLEDKFGVKFKIANLFSDVKRIKPSEWLVSALKRGEKFGIGNEKSRSERILSPILLEIALLNEKKRDSFAIISGMNLDVDASLGLNGECDFMFSFDGSQELLAPPIFCIAEAKKQDLEAGIIQASAQVIGAKKYNEIENFPCEILFGATTTGEVWHFLKFQNNEIIFDKKHYYIANLPQLLGVLQNVIDTVAKIVFKD